MKKIIFPILIIVIFSFCLVNKTKAGADDNVWGWAWSENIGWIKFNNCTNPAEPATCGSINYGVSINPSTGVFSGYSWSENIGWISFNRSETGAPPAEPYLSGVDYIALLDTSFSPPQASGWARALAYGGGWDGWMKLRGSNYGVSLNTTPDPDEFEGWAWSDMIIGWASFSCNNQGVCGTSDYKVMTNLSLNQSPDKPTGLSETWNHCSLQGTSKVTLSWQYSDPNGDPQDSYQVLIDNNSDFSSLEIDSCNTALSGGVDTCQAGNSSWNYTPIPSLAWNTTYYWKVKVKDNQGNWSDWSDVDSFLTPSHAYPYPDFSFSPKNPAKEQVIQFCSIEEGCPFSPANKTVFYGVVPAQRSFSWDFDDGATSNLPNPTHSYLNTGSYQVELTACDEVGCCSISKPLKVSIPLPEWKEIPPTSWLDKFLAVISGIFRI